jgi:hypothetical protein
MTQRYTYGLGAWVGGGGVQQLSFPNRSIAVLGRSRHGLKEVHFISAHSLIFSQTLKLDILPPQLSKLFELPPCPSLKWF